MWYGFLSMLFWAFFLDSRRGCGRGLHLAILSRECQDTMCVSVLVAEIRAPGDIRVRFVKGTKKVVVKRKNPLCAKIPFVISVASSSAT